MTIRVHAFFHVSFERLGSIYDWLSEHDCKLTSTNFFDQSAKLPDASNIDMLIVMGGPMSVCDEASHQWLKEEKKFIADFIAAGKPVLGICLGGQLLADVLGAKVFKNKQKEIGWFDVNFTEDFLKCSGFSHLPQAMKLFHWHGDAFELPSSAIRIGSSEATVNQGFIYNDKVLALQFHPEATISACKELRNNCLEELKEESPYIQCTKRISEGSHLYSEGGRQFVFDIMNYLKVQVGR
jgi:GMP synthase-like glutamine amidotransferase